MAQVKIKLKKGYTGTKVLPGGKYLRPGNTVDISHEIWDKIQVDRDIEFVEEVVEVGKQTIAMIETERLQEQHEKIIVSKDGEMLKLKRELETLKQQVIKQGDDLSDPIVRAASIILKAHWQKRLSLVDEVENIEVLETIKMRMRAKGEERTSADNRLLSRVNKALAAKGDPSVAEAEKDLK